MWASEHLFRPLPPALGGLDPEAGWLAPVAIHIFCSVPFELEAATLVWPAAVTSRSHEHMPGSRLLPHLTKACFLYCQPRGGEGGASRPEVSPPRISIHITTRPRFKRAVFQMPAPRDPSHSQEMERCVPSTGSLGPPSTPCPRHCSSPSCYTLVFVF